MGGYVCLFLKLYTIVHKEISWYNTSANIESVVYETGWSIKGDRYYLFIKNICALNDH